MSEPTASYLKVPYDLRPAKQVERRMLVEAFETLSHIGFPIRSYQYTGVGSIYYIDFILFHKMLGLKHLLSVEIDERIRKRVRFNQPFRCVDVRLGKIGDYIPMLSKNRRHILWLDYDNTLQRDHVEDLWLAAASLRRHSVLLVTVDVEPPLKGKGPREWRDYFRNEAPNYLGAATRLQDFAGSKLLLLNRDILVRAITSGTTGREVEYIPLFAFSYADGHEMLTIGGMLGTVADRARIEKSVLKEAPYIRLQSGSDPFRISVPLLTRKERIHLDKLMPAAPGWRLTHFELPPELVRAYKTIYRYMPTYAELLF